MFKLFTLFYALFAYNSIPIETDPIEGVLLSIDTYDKETYHIWDKIIDISNANNIKSYIYITDYTKNDTFIHDRYKNSIITDYHTDTIWMRDYGPIFYKNNDKYNILKIHYRHHRKYDNLMPYDFSYRFNIPINKIELVIEGGNLISNGNGICIISDKVLEYNSYKSINQLKYYGCWKQIIIVKSLKRDGTRHVDMWLMWINKNTLFAGLYTIEQDKENYNIMMDNLIQIRKYIPNINIVEMPMPDRGEDDITRTYVNALILNNHVIIPTYEDNIYEARAISIWKQYFKYIHPINAESLIKYDGSIHCIARTKPK